MTSLLCACGIVTVEVSVNGLLIKISASLTLLPKENYGVRVAKFLKFFESEIALPFFVARFPLGRAPEIHTVRAAAPMWRNGRRNGLKIRWA